MDKNQPFTLSQQLKSVLLTLVGSFPQANATASQGFWILGKNSLSNEITHAENV